MSLYSLYKTYQPILSFLLIIFAPSLLPRLLRFGQRRRSPAPGAHEQQPREPWSQLLWAALFLHTSYHVLQLIYPSYDLFGAHSLPLLASNAQLRAAIVRSFFPSSHAAGLGPDLADTHPALELLLQKLQNLDNRLAYIRFGHDSLVSGHWGDKWEDYALIALPGIMSAYLLEAAFLGLLSWTYAGGLSAPKRAGRWRRSFSWLLAGLAVGEMGVRCLWDLRPVKGDCLHLSARIHTLRCAVFLLLPIVYLLLPLTVTFEPASLFPALLSTQNSLRMSALARTAVSQDESLRDVWIEAGKRTELQSRAARDDIHVKREMAAYRVNEDAIRHNARQAIRSSWSGLHTAP